MFVIPLQAVLVDTYQLSDTRKNVKEDEDYEGKKIIQKMQKKMKEWKVKTERKIKIWWSCHWNILDFTTLLLYFVAFGLSFYFQDASRIMMAISGFFWFIKIAKYFRTFQTLGPYMVMIFKMVRQKYL